MARKYDHKRVTDMTDDELSEEDDYWTDATWELEPREITRWNHVAQEIEDRVSPDHP